jgi:hypothetical protein
MPRVTLLDVLQIDSIFQETFTGVSLTHLLRLRRVTLALDRFVRGNSSTSESRDHVEAYWQGQISRRVVEPSKIAQPQAMPNGVQTEADEAIDLKIRHATYRLIYSTMAQRGLLEAKPLDLSCVAFHRFRVLTQIFNLHFRSVRGLKADSPKALARASGEPYFTKLFGDLPVFNPEDVAFYRVVDNENADTAKEGWAYTVKLAIFAGSGAPILLGLKGTTDAKLFKESEPRSNKALLALKNPKKTLLDFAFVARGTPNERAVFDVGTEGSVRRTVKVFALVDDDATWNSLVRTSSSSQLPYNVVAVGPGFSVYYDVVPSMKAALDTQDNFASPTTESQDKKPTPTAVVQKVEGGFLLDPTRRKSNIRVAEIILNEASELEAFVGVVREVVAATVFSDTPDAEMLFPYRSDECVVFSVYSSEKSERKRLVRAYGLCDQNSFLASQVFTGTTKVPSTTLIVTKIRPGAPQKPVDEREATRRDDEETLQQATERVYGALDAARSSVVTALNATKALESTERSQAICVEFERMLEQLAALTTTH